MYIEAGGTYCPTNRFMQTLLNYFIYLCLYSNIEFYMLIQQAALDKDLNKDKDSSVEDLNQAPAVEVVTSELNNLNIATNSSAAVASSDSIEPLGSQDPVPDIDKKIRALKKKVNTSCM